MLNEIHVVSDQKMKSCYCPVYSSIASRRSTNMRGRLEGRGGESFGRKEK
jgi:hypothetical protein